MRKVPARGQVVKGIDVSHWDAVINFEDVKLSGREFVIAKCTEYNADKNYSRNRAGALKAGLLFGAYHFFHPGKNPAMQAYNFLNLARLEKGNLIPVLDWESTDGLPSAEDRVKAQVWLDIVEKAIGKKPMIYTAPFFARALGLEPFFGDYPLWIAHYGTNAPLIPPPWTNWAFWQHTSKGDVPGIPSPDEDLDLFNGTYLELLNFLI